MRSGRWMAHLGFNPPGQWLASHLRAVSPEALLVIDTDLSQSTSFLQPHS